MVNIDKQKCIACKVCINICHEHCMEIVDNTIRIDYNSCSTCGQCIAICSRQALMWNEVGSVTFNDDKLPGQEQMDELLKQRHTIRHFTSQTVDKELLEEIVNYGIYAPAHSFDFRAIIVENKEIMKSINNILFSYSRRIYLLLNLYIMKQVVRITPPVVRKEYSKIISKLTHIKNRGSIFISFPSAFIFIIADKNVPLALESAQYALYSIELYANTKKLGCRNLVGSQGVLNNNKSFRKLINLGKKERIVGIMGIGYSKYIFKNKIEGKVLNTTWLN